MMVDFTVYNLKVAMMLGLFFILYRIFLRHETFYQFNRIYLLGALVFSLLVPLINIPVSMVEVASENNFEYVQHTFSEFTVAIEEVKTAAVGQVTAFPVVIIIFLGGMSLALVRVGFQLFSIYKIIEKNEIIAEGRYRYVLICESTSTYSFFNYIFVQRADFRKKHMRDVLQHEKIHADRGHSLDMLFVGILSILQWFNPFIYLLKRALVETHEFQADQTMINAGTDKIRYQRLLLAHAESIVATGFTSSFNQSIIKNRFKMMNKIKSGNSAIFKYVLVIPVVFIIGILFSFSQEKIDSSLGTTLMLRSGTLSPGSGGEELNYSARDSIVVNGNLVTLYGDATVRSSQASLHGAVAYIDKDRGKAYTSSDDYTPSIYPIDKGEFHRLTSNFGMRTHPITKEKKMHNGIDFSAETGTPIKATAHGTIREAQQDKSYGNRVIIDHGHGFSTSYSQMQRYIVQAGQSVEKGEVIGYVGSTGISTGPHLHYEVMKDGQYVDPADYLE